MVCTKLKYSFELLELDGREVAVPIGEGVQAFRGIIKLNDTASKVFELLRTETNEQAIINAISEHYEAPIEEISRDVYELISELRERGLLEP